MISRRIERVLLVLMLIGGLWFGASAAVIQQVRLEGGNAAVYADAKALLRQLHGNNLLMLDLAAWRTRLLHLSAVSDARLQRHLPNTLVVTLTTRRPLAVWGKGGLVDTEGHRYTGHTPERLPIFTGPAARATSMVKFYHYVTKVLKPLEESVAQLQVDEDGAWRVFLDSGRVLYLGRDDRRVRLQRYADNINTVRQHFADVKVIDLRYERGFSIIVSDNISENEI